MYGRTNNPWDLSRGPGGGSGGEAAIIAAGGSPLGLGNDLGGSVRIPAHFCGIHAIKPTHRRLSQLGVASNLRGMEAIQFQPGPMARRVEDLSLALRVLEGERRDRTSSDAAPSPIASAADVKIDGLRIAVWTDDGYFPTSPAIRRAVGEAGESLRLRGAVVETFCPPDVHAAMRIYFGLVSADGGADFRRLLRGSEVDPRIRRLLRLSRSPRRVRPALGWMLRRSGQKRLAELVTASGPRSADDYWQLSHERTCYERRFMAALAAGPYDAMIFPPHALPAPPHGVAVHLMPAASYAFLPNLLGIPAGVVAATRVRHDEQSDRIPGRDAVDRIARQVETESAGLPVGVQVAACHWREDIVLAVMEALESHFRSTSDYPAGPDSASGGHLRLVEATENA